MNPSLVNGLLLSGMSVQRTVPRLHLGVPVLVQSTPRLALSRRLSTRRAVHVHTRRDVTRTALLRRRLQLQASAL